MSKPAKTVQPVHFEDFSGRQFERLVFAYHLRSDKWRSLEWYGQSGSDLGRDIWGEREAGGSLCIQCVNRQALSATKVIRDLNKIVRARAGIPDSFLVVCGSPVSAKMRDKVKEHARTCGITQCEIWSSEEFEERLRQHAENLLRRFIDGELFPDDPTELRHFAESKAVDDAATIERFIQVFDRPAFRTPFHQESSLPAFRQAIGDTIQTLNTGIWQTRTGEIIDRLPSRHQLSSPILRNELAVIVTYLTKLWARFEQLIRDGQIRPCTCNLPDCPTFFLSPAAVEQMDTLRAAIISRMHGLRRHENASQKPPAQSISVVSSKNTGIIANQVIIRGGARPRAIILPGSIGAEPEKYNYVEYLIKQLTKFREVGAKYGQRRNGRVHPGSTRKILEKQLGGLPKDLLADRFEAVVAYLQNKIDDTALGRNNRKKCVPNYHSFENQVGQRANTSDGQTIS